MLAVGGSADPLDQARALLRASFPAIGAAYAGVRGESAEAAAVLCHPALLTLAPGRALELELSLLCMLCGAPRATLWLAGVTGTLAPRTHHGAGRPSDEGRRAAACLVDRGDGPPGGGVAAAAVRRWAAVQGAVVVEDAPTQLVEACVGIAAGMVGALLDREVQLVRSTRSEEALAQSSERRLTRLMLDLHDGRSRTLRRWEARSRRLKRIAWQESSPRTRSANGSMTCTPGCARPMPTCAA